MNAILPKNFKALCSFLHSFTYSYAPYTQAYMPIWKMIVVFNRQGQQEVKMVKSHRIAVSAALVAASLFAATPAISGDGTHCDRKHHAGKMGHHGEKHGFHQKLKELNLTETQQAQVKDIMEKQKPQREAKWKEMSEARKALHEAARSDTYDSARVRELAGKQAQIKADMTVMRIETLHQVYALLTPEQKQKWDAKRDQHHDAVKS
jgi:protein CpxP